MKKFLLITFLSILTVSYLSSQEKNKKDKYNLGLVGGLNINYFEEESSSIGLLTDKNDAISEFTTSYLGAFGEMKLSEKFSLRGEILYAMGADSDFFEIPVILRYKITDRLFVYGGVQLNYMLEERNDFFNKAGLGFNIGLEYNFSNNWFVDLRYVYKDSQHTRNSSFNYDPQIQSIRLGIGYRF